jgi:uncharacterized protein YukE
LGIAQLRAEATQAASDDTGSAVAAADAISGLIKNVQALLNPDTWRGAAADNWMGEWNSFYGQLLRMLNELPAAQATVMKNVNAEMAALERRQ